MSKTLSVDALGLLNSMLLDDAAEKSCASDEFFDTEEYIRDLVDKWLAKNTATVEDAKRTITDPDIGALTELLQWCASSMLS